MASSMMDSILGMVTSEMKQALATRLGASPQAVETGLAASTAATLSGIADKAGDSGFLGQIVGLLGGGAGQSILASLPSIASGGPVGTVGDVINKFLPMVFGTQQGQVAGTIAQSAGLSAGSGLSLLKMAAPLVLAHFAKLQSAGSTTASALGNTLRAEAPSLRSYLPAGLLPAAPGVTSAAHAGAAIATPVASAGTPRWLWPVGIVAALLLGWLVIRSMSGPAQPVRSAANVATEAASAAWAALGELVKVKLPDGTDLNVPSLGVEARLVKFLSDNSAPAAETSWFDFDRLLFDTGKATLQPASQEQLANVAAILKAFPQVKVRIGGYTDNTGDPAANLRLSQQRADNVMAELTRLGIDPSRMSAMGYGQDGPIADNSTEEGRQKNRRISLLITEKPAATS